MTKAGAQDAISASALIVGGIYLYRRLVETPSSTPADYAGPAGMNPSDSLASYRAPFLAELASTDPKAGKVAQLAGVGPVAPVSRFVVGWGFTFVVLSLVAQGSPDLGGWFALLVATGAILGNGTTVSKDITDQLNRPPDASAGDATPTVAVDFGGGSSSSPAIGGTGSKARGGRRPQTPAALRPRQTTI